MVAGPDVADYHRVVAQDTDQRAREAQLAALRRLGPARRFELAAAMSEDARRIAIEGELRRHPEMTESEARRAVLARGWGADLASRVHFAPRGR